MRYADVEVGQTYLFSHYRPSQRHFDIERAEMAEVLAKGVYHRYQVQPTGWSYSLPKDRQTGQGIWLRVTRHDRRSVEAGNTEPLPETYKTVTLAAYLHPAEGENLAVWQGRRRAEAEWRAEQAAVKAAEGETAARFAAAGYQVKVAGDRVTLAAADAERLLAAAERGGTPPSDTGTR